MDTKQTFSKEVKKLQDPKQKKQYSPENQHITSYNLKMASNKYSDIPFGASSILRLHVR